jgi:hypothetical protein
MMIRYDSLLQHSVTTLAQMENQTYTRIKTSTGTTNKLKTEEQPNYVLSNTRLS